MPQKNAKFGIHAFQMMPKYSKKRIERICKLIEEDDYTVNEICKHSGISEATYYQWKLDHSEFSEAIKRAEDKRLDMFKQAARSGLLTLLRGKEYEETSVEFVEGKDGKPKIKNQKKVKKVILPNPTSVIFTLKNLDPDNFPELLRNEVTGKDGQPLPVPIINIMPPSNNSADEQ